MSNPRGFWELGAWPKPIPQFSCTLPPDFSSSWKFSSSLLPLATSPITTIKTFQLRLRLILNYTHIESNNVGKIMKAFQIAPFLPINRSRLWVEFRLFVFNRFEIFLRISRTQALIGDYFILLCNRLSDEGLVACS